MPASSADTYLFIDGEYLRRVHNDAMQSVFRCDGEIDFQELKRVTDAKRAFFYDCLDDVKRQNETDRDYEARVAAQEAYFGDIRSLKGYHVRLGSLRGSAKRLRQKEVDVLLATDMLTHGYDGNIEKAVLIAGDLDFRPIVDALVRRGVFVEIWYEQKSGAKELWWAADFGRELNFRSLYALNTNSFQSRNRLPRSQETHDAFINITLDRRGLSKEGREVHLMQDSGRGEFALSVTAPGTMYWFMHDDRGVLERYFEIVFGPIDWQ